MKLFNTSDIAFMKQCQEQFNLTPPSVALERRRTSSVALTSSRDQAVYSSLIPTRTFAGIDIALPLYFFFCFLFHCYLCCILLPYVVNKDFHIVQNEIEENEYTLQAYSTEKTRQT